MGLLLEFMSIVYLSSKGTFQLILISYATMAALGGFDTLYSVSLQEHPCREIIGKKMCTVWRRSMCFHKEEMIKAIKETLMKKEDEVVDKEATDEVEKAEQEKKQEEAKEDYERHEAILQYLEAESPSDHLFFIVLRTITKVLRLFYVSFFFYFAPFYLLIYNYFLEQQKQYENRH